MASSFLRAVVLLNALTGVSAFWRMECRGRAGLARIDPLISPGEASQHAHTIHGSSAFSESATYDDLLAGNCTSCAVTEDKSAYWTPPLYFQHSNGTFEIVPQVGGMLSYYLLRDPNNNVTAFPENFRMIAGNTLRRNYTLGDPSQPDPPQSNWAALGQTSQDDLSQRALGFNCLNYAITPEASLYRHYMPDKAYLDANCLDGIRLELMFPSCWDGVHVDSDDHKSHMAYPDLVQDGDCPSGFPVRLVSLFYETIWSTHQFSGVSGQFVLANGDPTGFGYHGDFMTGWDVDFLQQAVDQCTNLSGLIEDCPIFSIQTEATQEQCHLNELPQVLVVENLVGGGDDPLTALPGNVQIQSGPQQATLGAIATAETTINTYTAPTLTYKPATSSSYPGGAILLEVTSSPTAVSNPTIAAAPEVPATTPDPVTTPAATFVPDPNVSYEAVSTELHTSGALVQEIIWEEAVVYVTEDTVTTVTVNAAESSIPRKERRDHLLRHRHHVHRR